MFNSFFFGIYVGISMAMSILIDINEKNTWNSAWFVILAWMVLRCNY
jgi:hypothetical protein